MEILHTMAGAQYMLNIHVNYRASVTEPPLWVYQTSQGQGKAFPRSPPLQCRSLSKAHGVSTNWGASQLSGHLHTRPESGQEWETLPPSLMEGYVLSWRAHLWDIYDWWGSGVGSEERETLAVIVLTAALILFKQSPSPLIKSQKTG